MDTDLIIKFLSIILDAAVVITIPIYILLIAVLRKKRAKELGPSFQRCIFHISCCMLVVCCVSIFVNEPAALGFFHDFFMEQGWWFGKLSNICQFTFAINSLFWTFSIAVSRVWALWRPMTFEKDMKSFLNPFVFLFWVISIMVGLPLAYPINAVPFFKYTNSIGFRYGLNDYPQFRPFYNYYGLFANTACFLSIVSYTVLICLLPRAIKEIKGSTLRVTIAAMISTAGSVIVMITVGVELIPWIIFEERIWSEAAYYFFYKVGSDVHTIGFGWVTLALFRNIRREITGKLFGSHNYKTTNGGNSGSLQVLHQRTFSVPTISGTQRNTLVHVL